MFDEGTIFSMVLCPLVHAVKQAPTSSSSTFSSHHPHLYTVEEDCALAKGDEDILYLHTGQDQGQEQADQDSLPPSPIPFLFT
ncbi:hypothetical protein EMCRGX_G013197 [Ephydatia muelleri]|eukprot:Em0004g884a